MFDSHIGGAAGSVRQRRARFRTAGAPRGEPHALRRDQARVLVARGTADAPGRGRPRDRGDRLPCLLHLPARGCSPDDPRRLAGVRRRRRQGPVLGRGGAHRLGCAASDARVHPRPGDGGPADEVRADAPGGAVPVDGCGADPRPLGGHDRRDRAAHPGARTSSPRTPSSCSSTSPRWSAARSRMRSSTTASAAGSTR